MTLWLSLPPEVLAIAELARVLLFMCQPFRLRDRIAVMSFEGTVVGMDLRYTTLQVEAKRVIVPNSVLFTNPISVFEARLIGALSGSQP